MDLPIDLHTAEATYILMELHTDLNNVYVLKALSQKPSAWPDIYHISGGVAELGT